LTYIVCPAYIGNTNGKSGITKGESMKERSTDRIERILIRLIFNGEFKPGEALPPERELAAKFESGRPAVREALQRLERDGWITIRKSLPAMVNDYWRQGNLMTIVHLLKNYQEVPDEFVDHMLELRIAVAPAYMRDAAAACPVEMIALLAGISDLEDEAGAYAEFDWKLQREAAMLSSNPMYLLLLNSFAEIYHHMAVRYFAEAERRQATRVYYDELLDRLMARDPAGVEQASRAMMSRSLELWKKTTDRSVK
jgi:GntR family transcriptional regulator, negative regulator for fad regulon and positive regulator of fabA